MATTHTSRTGTFPEEGIKAPCLVSSGSNLTLSGERTVGVTAVVSGDRVLARGQTDTTENGIWLVDTGVWTRPTDWSDSRDVVRGILVTDYTNNTLYKAVFTGTFVAGTTAVTFASIISGGGAAGIISVNRSEHVLAQTDDTSGVHAYDFEATHVYLNGRLLPTSDYVENVDGTVTLNDPVELSDGADLIIVTHNST